VRVALVNRVVLIVTTDCSWRPPAVRKVWRGLDQHLSLTVPLTPNDGRQRWSTAGRSAIHGSLDRPQVGLRLECPGCGGDIRLIAFITDPGPIRKILTHLG